MNLSISIISEKDTDLLISGGISINIVPSVTLPAYYVAWKNSFGVFELNDIAIGDIVARKSYAGDVFFRVTNIMKREYREPIYVLKGLLLRLEADSKGDDLIKLKEEDAKRVIKQEILKAKRYALRTKSLISLLPFKKMRAMSGKILHIDADGEFLNKCLRYYTDAKLKSVGKLISEEEQPYSIRQLLKQYRPDIIVVTGHDGIKKGSAGLYSIDNYKNSKYYVQSAKEARSFEPDFDKLCIFAGACQSYYEEIMKAGSNFASSPARILINALDPAFVSEKIALTDKRIIVSPREIAKITICGSDGISGINTRGHLGW